jgi:hypothetical protein
LKKHYENSGRKGTSTANKSFPSAYYIEYMDLPKVKEPVVILPEPASYIFDLNIGAEALVSIGGELQQVTTSYCKGWRSNPSSGSVSNFVGLNLTRATGWETKLESRSGSAGVFNDLLSVGHVKALSILWRKLHSNRQGY